MLAGLQSITAKAMNFVLTAKVMNFVLTAERPWQLIHKNPARICDRLSGTSLNCLIKLKKLIILNKIFHDRVMYWLYYRKMTFPLTTPCI